MNTMKTMKKISYVILILSFIAALYIMMTHMGLSKELNFGAGAYYYADIPEFERYIRDDVYESQVSIWIIMVIFLIWRAVMYKLWLYIDSRKEDKY